MLNFLFIFWAVIEGKNMLCQNFKMTFKMLLLEFILVYFLVLIHSLFLKFAHDLFIYIIVPLVMDLFC